MQTKHLFRPKISGERSLLSPGASEGFLKAQQATQHADRVFLKEGKLALRLLQARERVLRPNGLSIDDRDTNDP